MLRLFFIAAQMSGESLDLFVRAENPLLALQLWRSYYELSDDADADSMPRVFEPLLPTFAHETAPRALAWGEDVVEIAVNQRHSARIASGATYRRENLAIRATKNNDTPDWPECATDDEADAFELYTKDDGQMVDYFDTRKEAEEYLDLIAV